MKNTPSRIIIGIAAVVVIVSAGLLITHKSSPASTSSSTMPMTTSSTPVATNKVTISDYMFMPMSVTVKTGATVTWTNQDAVAHTVTVDSGDGPSSALFGQGQIYSYTFKKAGTYTYRCNVHPQMHGTITVTN